eukprot:scaffold28428_cov19-Tisochrysis_lutea.AAC.1
MGFCWSRWAHAGVALPTHTDSRQKPGAGCAQKACRSCVQKAYFGQRVLALLRIEDNGRERAVETKESGCAHSQKVYQGEQAPGVCKRQAINV